jgi:hypothetical protein
VVPLEQLVGAARLVALKEPLEQWLPAAAERMGAQEAVSEEMALRAEQVAISRAKSQTLVPVVGAELRAIGSELSLSSARQVAPQKSLESRAMLTHAVGLCLHLDEHAE